MKNSFVGKNGPILIAEIGGNHEGNFDYAKKLLKDAISTDVDVIKFQIYFPETLVNKKVDKNRYNHFKKFTLSKNQHIELAKICRNSGKKYLASVWDIDALNWIDDYCDFYKIGSGDFTALELIDAIIEKKKPIIISTGLSSEKEIDDLLSYIIAKDVIYNDENMLALHQCTSMYPIPENEVNLNVMDSYRTKYKLSVGYSDHTEDQEALYISVIKGAKILEFHFTDDKNNTTFRDHKVSLDNADIKMLIERIKRFNIISGLKTKNPTQSEIENNHVESFRRALYFNKNMEMNQVIKSNDIISLRPNVGIDARHYHDIIGKKLRVNVEKLSVLDFNMFYEK